MTDAPPTPPAAEPGPRLALDAPAPPFEARSTHGPLRLSDFRGRWLVFFSHPADFTPVCTTEFLAFARAQDRFAAMDCALLGLSVDSVYAHLAWIADIKARHGVEIGFPVVEDISMSIARAYGMLHPDAQTTAAVRAVVVIDPNGVTRAISAYPMNVGRSVEEILRLVAALQTADAQGVVTPEGWRPGEPAVLPPPETQAEMAARSLHPEAGIETGRETGRSWYLTPVDGGRRAG